MSSGDLEIHIATFNSQSKRLEGIQPLGQEALIAAVSCDGSTDKNGPIRRRGLTSRYRVWACLVVVDGTGTTSASLSIIRNAGR